MDGYGPIINKRRSFLSTLALGVSAVVITVILTGGAVAMYGLNILDRKSDNVFDLARAGVDNLPEFVESLPPMLADVVNHERDPDYAANIEVSARLARSDRGPGYVRPIVEVKNLGDEVVSLLSMRIAVMNEDGEPIAECNEFAATPVAIEDDWRGPLLPHAKPRTFRAGHFFNIDDDIDTSALKVECEITDVRVWKRPTGKAPVPAEETTIAGPVIPSDAAYAGRV
jgi:hypothetical protein